MNEKQYKLVVEALLPIHVMYAIPEMIFRFILATRTMHVDDNTISISNEKLS